MTRLMKMVFFWKTIKLTTERILGLVYRVNIAKLIDKLF